MDIKQDTIQQTNTVQPYNTLLLYHSQPTSVQYSLYNLFRILRPLRVKYRLSINELIILTGIVTYNRLVSSTFSVSSIRKYVGYFNCNKMNYYIKTLTDKQCIVVADIYNGYNRYKITTKGIEIIDQLDDCYTRSLNKFIIDNGISV